MAVVIAIEKLPDAPKYEWSRFDISIVSFSKSITRTHRN